MQNHDTTSASAGSKLFLKLAAAPHRTFENANAYAPELRIGHCCACGCDTLAIELRPHAGLFAATTEPSCPWIRIGIPLDEFFWLTNLTGVHRCGRVEVLQ
jgi:hypothetical protein